MDASTSFLTLASRGPRPCGSLTSTTLRGHVGKSVVRIAAFGSFALLATSASAKPELSEAFGTWFSTDRAITCVDPDGRERHCSLANAESIFVNRNPDDTLALVSIPYLTDATAIGDATQIAVAVFRRDERGWHFFRTLPNVKSAPVGKVTFGNGKVSFAIPVPKRGDPRCCPSGRRQVAFELR